MLDAEDPDLAHKEEDDNRYVIPKLHRGQTAWMASPLASLEDADASSSKTPNPIPFLKIVSLPTIDRNETSSGIPHFMHAIKLKIMGGSIQYSYS